MTFTVTESYTTFTCWSCRGLSGVEVGAYNTIKRDGKHLHCVLCGAKNWWPDASAEKQLAAERAAHDQTKENRKLKRPNAAVQTALIDKIYCLLDNL